VSIWCVLVPVKRLDRAKTRLHASRPDGTLIDRPALALAFASDVVVAALAADRVAHVVVVTDDDLAARTLTALGAQVVPDSPDAGINPALAHGRDVAIHRWPGLGVAALSSDVPSARAADIDAALEAAQGWPGASFLADTSGIGTTMLMAPLADDFAPNFGKRSRAAHRAAGLREITDEHLFRLRRDVDTAVDLWDARRIGVGSHTAGLLDSQFTKRR